MTDRVPWTPNDVTDVHDTEVADAGLLGVEGGYEVTECQLWEWPNFDVLRFVAVLYGVGCGGGGMKVTQLPYWVCVLSVVLGLGQRTVRGSLGAWGEVLDVV